MGETYQYNHHHHNRHQHQQPAATTSRVGMRNPGGGGGGGGGEIVEVQGGHIVRSTGRKDRHSKVCTAKGPRDRRVRLSAHTAIQFYDVQDRLGYDRPSKAVDWLIKKAKVAIDELAVLPAWKPTVTKAPQREEEKTHKPQHQQQQQQQHEESSGSEKEYNSSNNIQIDSFQISFQNQQQQGTGFLPPSLDSDAIADTIKSFFPMGASGGGETDTVPPDNSIQQFQTYPVPDLLSRTSSSGGGHNQDLRLSLQSFQEPNHVLFPGVADHYLGGGFNGPSSSSSAGAGGWSEQDQNPVEIGRFQRMVAAWNTCGGGGGDDSIFNSMLPPQTAVVQPVLFGQNHHHHHHQLLISQRGPLQSSNSPSVRAWIDPPGVGIGDQILQFHPGIGFGGFRVPARIQGDQEEHDGIPNKPSSVSSDSRH